MNIIILTLNSINMMIGGGGYNWFMVLPYMAEQAPIMKEIM